MDRTLTNKVTQGQDFNKVTQGQDFNKVTWGQDFNKQSNIGTGL